MVATGGRSCRLVDPVQQIPVKERHRVAVRDPGIRQDTQRRLARQRGLAQDLVQLGQPPADSRAFADEGVDLVGLLEPVAAQGCE